MCAAVSRSGSKPTKQHLQNEFVRPKVFDVPTALDDSAELARVAKELEVCFRERVLFDGELEQAVRAHSDDEKLGEDDARALVDFDALAAQQVLVALRADARHLELQWGAQTMYVTDSMFV